MSCPLAGKDGARPLSRTGLGTWAFGGTGWGAQDDRHSRAAILRAVELGIDWIDTAAVYGAGRAEQVVGSALAELSPDERPLIFTKAGVRIDPQSGRTYRDLAPGSLRAECEDSLRRLGVERIDLYQLHWPVEDVASVQAAWETLDALQRDGKIRWVGVSNFDIALLDACAALRRVDAVQVPLSLLSRTSCRDILPWAARRGTHALTYSSLESGLLSGGITPQRLRALGPGDWRGRRPQFQQPQLDRTWALLDRLRPLAADLGASLVELAIAWALAWPDVDGVIVGARDREQVEGWARSSALILDQPTLEAIETALLQTGAGEGPVHPGVPSRGRDERRSRAG